MSFKVSFIIVFSQSVSLLGEELPGAPHTTILEVLLLTVSLLYSKLSKTHYVLLKRKSMFLGLIFKILYNLDPYFITVSVIEQADVP